MTYVVCNYMACLMGTTCTNNYKSCVRFNNKCLKLEVASRLKTHCNCRREAEMHPCLLKVKASMRRDCRKRQVHLLRLSNQACRACPLRRLAKCGCPRSPMATAKRIRFRKVGFMLFDRGHAKDVPLDGKRFSAPYRYIVIDP